MPTSLITSAAIPLLAAASGNATSVAITEIALGDGGGAAYDPNAGQTALVNERLRVPIASRRFLAPQRWRVMAEVPSEASEFPMREIGFFADDGTLVGIWAGSDVTARGIGVTIYRIFYHLDLSAAPEGSVVVEADNDDLYRHTLTDLESHGVLGNEQIKQRLLIRDLTNQLTELTARVAALEA